MTVKYALRESEMIPMLSEFDSPTFRNSSHILTEVDLGFGIADVVRMAPNRDNIEKRNRHQLTTPITSVRGIRVLNLISATRPTSVTQLLNRIDISETYLRNRILRDLASRRYIERVDRDRFIRIRDYYPVTDTILAIEAKLTDWQKGALQAKRYQLFSHYSFLALPERFLHRVDLAFLKMLNVGLLSVCKDLVKEVLVPKRNIRLNKEMFYLCNEFFLPKLFSRST
jgi:hypothetical protein